MTLALVVSASAATIDLGSLTWINQGNQAGWYADGFEEGDGVVMSGSATTAQWQAAKYLVIELNGDLDGAGLQTVWQGSDADGEGASSWNQKQLQVADVLDGNKLVLELAASLDSYDVFLTRAQVKVLVAYYEEDVADIIKKAYLTNDLGGGTTSTAPPAGNTTTAAAVSEDEKGGGETGLGDVAVASAIALVAAGAVVFSRKRK